MRRCVLTLDLEYLLPFTSKSQVSNPCIVAPVLGGAPLGPAVIEHRFAEQVDVFSSILAFIIRCDKLGWAMCVGGDQAAAGCLAGHIADALKCGASDGTVCPSIRTAGIAFRRER